MLSLSLIFNPTKDKVLMCFHKKIGQWNYIGGRSQNNETAWNLSYRELQEETGITSDDVTLTFVREEKTIATADYYPMHHLSKDWDIFVTAGILKYDVELVEEKNHLKWIDIDDVEHFVHASAGLGNCYTYLLEAMDVLGIKKQGE